MLPRLDLRGSSRPARFTLLSCLLLGAVTCPRLVRAEAPGLLLGGKLVLHPALATELRYDSNIYFSNSNAPDPKLPAYAFFLRIVPSISLSTLTAQRGLAMPNQRAVFRLLGSLDYREFLSPDPNLRVHRMLGGDLSAQLSLRPHPEWGVDLYDFYQRTTQPPYSVLPYNFNRNINVVGARTRYAPGGGRLTATLGLELGYDGYEDNPDGPKLSDFNLLYGTANLRTAWKFLPKTSLFIDLSQGIYHYLSATAAVQGRGDSYPLRASAGLLGLVTPRLSLQATGGYGYGFYSRGPSPATGLVQAEVRFRPTHFSNASLGYRHDFANSVLGSYFDLDSLGLTYSHSVMRILLSTRVSWDRMAFRGSPEQLRNAGVCQAGSPPPCDPQLDRVDNLITVDARAEYPLRDWMSTSVGYGLTTNQSNGSTILQMVTTSVSYIKHEVWLRATLRY